MAKESKVPGPGGAGLWVAARGGRRRTGRLLTRDKHLLPLGGVNRPCRGKKLITKKTQKSSG